MERRKEIEKTEEAIYDVTEVPEIYSGKLNTKITVTLKEFMLYPKIVRFNVGNREEKAINGTWLN